MNPKPYLLNDLPDPTGHQMTGLGLISTPPPPPDPNDPAPKSPSKKEPK